MAKPTIRDEKPVDDGLYDRVTAFEGCISMLAIAGCSIEVCYEALINAVRVKAVFKTPLGNVDLGSGKITPDAASIDFGGEKGKFSAKITIECNFDTGILKACGKVSVPLSSKKGCFEVQL